MKIYLIIETRYEYEAYDNAIMAYTTKERAEAKAQKLNDARDKKELHWNEWGVEFSVKEIELKD